MASGFVEGPEGLRYAEHISVAMRLFAGVLGLGMFLIPVPFVLHASLDTPWWHLLLAAACVLAGSAMGLLFMALGLWLSTAGGICRDLHLKSVRPAFSAFLGQH